MTGYWDALLMVALNDEPLLTDVDHLQGMPTTHLLSYVYKKPLEQVAVDLSAVRQGGEHLTGRRKAAAAYYKSLEV